MSESPTAMRYLNGIPVWGEADPDSLQQIERCRTPDAAGAALMADHHKGYSMPIGGVVGYRNMLSPSGVGYDIGCGNKAVRTPLRVVDVDIAAMMDAIWRDVAFGMGRKNPQPVDHPVLDDPTWQKPLYQMRFGKQGKTLFKLARDQLGTVGGGNHYVDLLADEDGFLWVAVHFGSRGAGWNIAAGFMNLGRGGDFFDKPRGENMDAPPILINAHTPTGQDYLEGMTLAGAYAYAGRDLVIEQVLRILGTRAEDSVHNHHNFAWREKHNDEQLWVVRKGATPAWPGQRSFIGGSMGDPAYIVRGEDTPESRAGLYSTIHGAGRVMSRTQAAGRMNFRKGRRGGGLITRAMMLQRIGNVVLRGGGMDEAPQAYKRIEDVIAAHAGTLTIEHVLRPVGVAMAGEDEFDPYKD